MKSDEALIHLLGGTTLTIDNPTARRLLEAIGMPEDPGGWTDVFVKPRAVGEPRTVARVYHRSVAAVERTEWNDNEA
jgi:hypothetical protein